MPGVYDSGGDGVDGDAARAEVFREVESDHLQGGFSHRVGDFGRVGEPGASAGDVDDPAPVGDEGFQGAHDVEGCLGVDPHEVVDVGRVEVGGRGGHLGGGVVDQDVYSWGGCCAEDCGELFGQGGAEAFPVVRPAEEGVDGDGCPSPLRDLV